jgi:single-stranded-DNA-specific exonuclease
MFHRWLTQPQTPALAQSLGAAMRLHPALAQVLINRGLGEPQAAQEFLNPGLDQMANPFDLPDLEPAAARLAEAVLGGEKIGLFGDYDADGVTATAVFVKFFRELGQEVAWRLPDRLTEGYGLNNEGVASLAAQGVRVLVTADCGSSDLEQVDLAGRLGLTVIVTDHHQPGPEAPPCLAFVNPARPGAPAEFRGLAGVGVIFYLLIGVRAKLRERGFFQGRPEPSLKDQLDLVALGTLADVVPVVGQNRFLLAAGLRLLAEPRRVDLAALAQAASQSGPVSARDVAFSLAPRINAAGRMGQPELGVELLLAESPAQAEELAHQIDRLNARRKQVETEVLGRARAQLLAQGDPRRRLALVAADPEWHSGVLGIVAARLAKEFNRPCFVLRIEGETASGSGRSIEAFALHDCLARLSPLLVRHGGHSQAAGLTIRTTELTRLGQALESEVGRALNETDLAPRLTIDAPLDLDAVDDLLVAGLDRLGPFGPGNSEPLFAADRVGLLSARAVGPGGSHLRLTVRQGRQSLPAIAFNHGRLWSQLGPLGRIAYRPVRASFRGREQLELHVHSILPVNGRSD